MTIREFLKEVGLTIGTFIEHMEEAHRRRMEAPTPCHRCQAHYPYKDLLPRLFWTSSSSPFYEWIRQRKGYFSHQYCPVCWDVLYKEYENEYRLATHYKREYERVDIHNKRAQQMGRPATLTITQWLTTLDFYDWRCAYCRGPYEALEHQRPLIAADGETTAKNCVPSCHSCNSWKGTRHPDEIMKKETSLSPEAHRRIQDEMEALHSSLMVREISSIDK